MNKKFLLSLDYLLFPLDDLDFAGFFAGFFADLDVELLGPPPILNIFVPQTLQVPFVAGLPFFIIICSSSSIFRFALHFTQ